MRMSSIALALFALCIGSAAQTERLCKNNADLVGACFSLHGKVYYSNGTPPLRIWKVGTKRILGILPAENEIVPKNLARALKGFDKQVYGNFDVCPFSKEKPGAMQMVCVESAKALRIRRISN
jgi:hypothetical protein